MRTQNQGPLIVGLTLIILGVLFLALNLADRLLRALDIGFSIWRLWPLALVLVGLIFFAPILIAWRERQRWAGLALPATIFLVNGLLLLYQSVTGDWDSWAYAWAFEPIAVGVGLFLAYLLGDRNQGLLVGAGIVGGIGVMFLIVFGSAFGGRVVGILAPLLLIGGGLALLLASFLRPHRTG